MSNRDLVAQVIALAGGKITGRVRFQKIFYLLSQKGLRTDLQFVFHHFGPFSRGLDEAISEAKTFCGVTEALESRGIDGVQYSVFYAGQPETGHGLDIGGLPRDEIVEFLHHLTSTSSTVIELAATIYWLRHEEGFTAWEAELKQRKGSKVNDKRVYAAVELLRRLSLDAHIESYAA